MKQTQTFAQRIKARLKSIGNEILRGTNNPNLVMRDHKHLSSEYRRVLTSPDVAISAIAKMLIDDPYFNDAAAELQGSYVIRACLVGDQIRANVHRLDRYPSGPLTPVFNHDWRREGITQYMLVTDGLNHKLHSLTTEFPTDLSFDYFEPVFSYQRELTDLEDRMISPVARLNWSQAA